MEQVEMNNMCINIGVNNGSEKGTEKILRLLGSQLKQYMVRMFICYVQGNQIG